MHATNADYGSYPYAAAGYYGAAAGAYTAPYQQQVQWNLQTTDTLGAGVLSAVERLSLSQRLANKPRPSILRLLILLLLLLLLLLGIYH